MCVSPPASRPPSSPLLSSCPGLGLCTFSSLSALLRGSHPASGLYMNWVDDTVPQISVACSSSPLKCLICGPNSACSFPPTSNLPPPMIFVPNLVLPGSPCHCSYFTLNLQVCSHTRGFALAIAHYFYLQDSSKYLPNNHPFHSTTFKP